LPALRRRAFDPALTAYDEVTLEIYHEVTVRLARQAKAAGARSFVLAACCSIYGVSSDAVATGNPRLSRYAESKWLAETELELADEAFTVTSLRFGTACGSATASASMSCSMTASAVSANQALRAPQPREVGLVNDRLEWTMYVDAYAGTR
jgi:nucleoside-diphosphate-sugar epimerase